MSDTSQKITHFLENQIPDYVQDYYPMFVIFVTKYFEFLEQNTTSVTTSIQNIRLNRDIDTTAQQLAVQFLNTYAPGLPNTSALDKSILVKYFRDFYKTKGSEKSFKFFFKAFFNDDIEVVYPREYMFSTSDGKWYKETTVRVQSNTGDPLNLANCRVTGTTSKAYATVNKVVQVVGQGGTNYYDLVLQPLSWVGVFNSSETITGITYDFDNNTSSIVAVSSVAAVSFADGRYLDTHSQLSLDQVLQDSVYYQHFSYVIKSKTSLEKWRDYILSQLHPTGTLMFSEFHSDSESVNRASTSFTRTQKTETTVRFGTVKTYLTAPTFTYDRLADYKTGNTSTTSIGVITYDATYDYPGENITWALQGALETYVYPDTREATRLDGPSFDKLSRKVGADQQIIQWPYDVNSSIVVRRYNTGYLSYTSTALTGSTHLGINSVYVTGIGTLFLTEVTTGQLITVGVSGINTTAYTVTNILSNTVLRVSTSGTVTSLGVTSYKLNLDVSNKTSSIAASTVIASITSGTLTYNIGSLPYTTSVGSMILLITWMKNSRGNANETANTVQIRFSSTSTIVPYFDAETQRNLYRVALGDSLSYNKLVYYASSNSVRPQTLLIGKVYTSSNSNIVTGVSTTFLSQLSVGDYVSLFDSSNTATSYLVLGISSNTNIVVSPTPVNNYGGVSSYLLTMSGMPLSANSTKARVTFKPYNFERGQTFDRFAMIIKMDKPEQLNTSMVSTFSTANVTANGFIASWSSLTTSVSTQYFNSSVYTGARYQFPHYSFVFNGIAGQSRFVQTTSFMQTEVLKVDLDYIVGDSYNGGEAPDAGEDLEIQYSLNGGTSWISASKLWVGGPTQWSLGNIQKTGFVYVSSGSTQVQGSDTLFLTDYVVGDVLTIGSSLTTAYTITGITNNNLMTVSPAVITTSSGLVLNGAVGYFSFYSSTGTITSNGDGTDNVSSVLAASSGIQVSGLTALTGPVTITTRIRSYTTGNLRFGYGSGSVVQVGTWTFSGTGGQKAGEWYVTSFTLTASGPGQLLINSTNRMVFDLDYIYINGQPAYYKPPVSQQFASTSLTVYNGVSTSAIVRVIQISATDANQDTYAIDNFRVTSSRTQATTGTVNISIAVSSNSTLNISDQDFFDITTIGTL